MCQVLITDFLKKSNYQKRWRAGAHGMLPEFLYLPPAAREGCMGGDDFIQNLL
jgi:hypothetical protein